MLNQLKTIQKNTKSIQNYSEECKYTKSTKATILYEFQHFRCIYNIVEDMKILEYPCNFPSIFWNTEKNISIIYNRTYDTTIHYYPSIFWYKLEKIFDTSRIYMLGIAETHYNTDKLNIHYGNKNITYDRSQTSNPLIYEHWNDLYFKSMTMNVYEFSHEKCVLQRNLDQKIIFIELSDDGKYMYITVEIKDTKGCTISVEVDSIGFI